MSFLILLRKQLFCKKSNNIFRRTFAAHNFFKTTEDNSQTQCRSDTGLVIGAYRDPEVPMGFKFTPTGDRYNGSVGGRLSQLLSLVKTPLTLGGVRIFYGLDPHFSFVAVTGLGRECQGYDVFEQLDEGKESIRVAAAVGCKALQELQCGKIEVESFQHAESSAEGSALAVWVYQENKSREKKIHIPNVNLYDDCDHTGWQIGLQKAAAQNLARQLMDTGANLMTPTSFAQNAVEVLCKTGVNVEVKVRSFAETHGMDAFLSASNGSCEPPIFLELSYYGTVKEERPVILVGKGVTYNSGGVCLKDYSEQKLMKGDMGGAACIVAALRAVASLQLPINVRAVIPLLENMPGCAAMRPGDVVRAMNGTTIEIEETDCAGRLAMADALCYAQTYWPRFIVDIGTMSKGMRSAMGASATGCFSNSEALWEYMLAASMHTGDRVWRLPLWEHFPKKLKTSKDVDLQTNGIGGNHHASNIAGFLSEFVPCTDWIHLDSFGVMHSNGIDHPYLREGMSGRPTRTIVEFLCQLVCHVESGRVDSYCS